RAPLGVAAEARCPRLGEGALQGHELRDGGVETERLEVLCHFLDGVVHRAFHVGFGDATLGVRGAVPVAAGVVYYEAPDAVEEARLPVYARVAPRGSLVPRPEEHEVSAHRVGA